ncbi:3'-5' exonuclease [bacterium]|nr:3'-5' exonuclease [bacterium]
MEHLLVLDIETIPDAEAAKGLIGLESADLSEQRRALEDYHLKATDGKNAFLRQPFHKVVAIGMVKAHIDYGSDGECYTLEEVRCGGEADSSEEQLIKGFFAYAGRMRPRLVTFNGRTFDIPVLKYRAMKYGVQASWLYQSGDKWNNYQSRYSADWHCDLLEVLSDYGASARIRLNEVCSILGLPGKFGPDGSDVMPMYDRGEMEAIRDYCETDVLNTYLVYLRHALHTGRTSAKLHDQAVDQVREWLTSQGETKKVYRDFLTAWQEAEVC